MLAAMVPVGYSCLVHVGSCWLFLVPVGCSLVPIGCSWFLLDALVVLHSCGFSCWLLLVRVSFCWLLLNPVGCSSFLWFLLVVLGSSWFFGCSWFLWFLLVPVVFCWFLWLWLVHLGLLGGPLGSSWFLFVTLGYC